MQPVTFTEAAEKYLENLDLENGRNIPDKKKKLEQQIVPYFGDIPLEAINRFEIERFKRHLLAQGLKESTVNRYLAVISQLFHKVICVLHWKSVVPRKPKIYAFVRSCYACIVESG